MSYDKAVDSVALEAGLTKICDAVRTKSGTSAQFAFPDAIADAVTAIPSGGGGSEQLNALIDRSITEINSNVMKIGNNTFAECKQLTSATFPSATAMGSEAFYNCRNLQTISAPSIATIESSALYNCYALLDVDFTNVKTIGANGFNSCRSLVQIELPNAETLGNDVFSFCPKLKTIKLYKAISLGARAFSYSGNIVELYLFNSVLCAATGDPGIPSACNIYVPSDLINQYKTATNWSKYASQFVAI